jgi:hypothetical protein
MKNPESRSGEWWLPQSLIDSIRNAPPIPSDEHGRPTTLLGRPIVYVDDLPAVPEDLFVPQSNDTQKDD